MHYDLYGFQVELNKEMTKAWYETYEGWNCECGHCRNFLALAKKRRLPASVLEVLKELEIPPEKPTYVCEIYQKEDGFYYQFSYRIVGTILNEDNLKSSLQSWGEGRCCHEPYPYGSPNFPTPHFDLEFWITLPWILEE